MSSWSLGRSEGRGGLGPSGSGVAVGLDIIWLRELILLPLISLPMQVIRDPAFNASSRWGPLRCERLGLAATRVDSVSAQFGVMSGHLWHARLGHLSYHILKVVSNKSPSSFPCNFNSCSCDSRRGSINTSLLLLGYSYFKPMFPSILGGDYVFITTYLINRTPSPNLKGKSPCELFLNNFWMLMLYSHHSTIEEQILPKSHTMCFLGYPLGYKGYKVYDLCSKKFLISRDVIFYEYIFPFHTLDNATSNISLNSFRLNQTKTFT
ncbi:hypothetical protein CR513_26793, partial [Mucuna pruriens]